MDINLADARAQLSALVERAAGGETIRIFRRGRPVAQLTGLAAQRRPLDVETLRRLTDAMPPSEEGASKLVRRMRDTDRY